jgi:hypothetical protein
MATRSFFFSLGGGVWTLEGTTPCTVQHIEDKIQDSSMRVQLLKYKNPTLLFIYFF